MTKPQVGVIQGRLTPSRGRGVQFFPTDEWEAEFATAASLSLTHIQWVFDTGEVNPLFEKSARKRVKELVVETGVSVRNADLQFLVARPIEMCDEHIFENVCEALADINAGGVEIPLLEASTLLNVQQSSRLEAARRFARIAENHGLRMSIETDPSPDEMPNILAELPDIGIVYDSGNSAGLGYDVRAEIAAYGDRITNVHIKDKKKGGTTVSLGEGDADFDALFTGLRSHAYNGPITLQAARCEDGEEAETVKKQLNFVLSHYV